MTTRRTVLRGLAGLTIVAAGGGVFRAIDTRALAPGGGPAYEPWTEWGSAAEEGPLAIVRAGILAANAHNTQPWRFVVTEDAIELHADEARHLGAFDPFRREMTLSLGCALENMVLAAEAEGLNPTLELATGPLPLGGPASPAGPMAILRLAPGDRRETELYQAIARRHTHRGAYDPTPIQPNLLAELRNHATEDVALFVYDNGPEKARGGQMTVEATEKIIADHEMAMDSAAWFRFTRRSVDTHRDGVTIDGFGLSPALTAAVKMLPAPSPEEADRQWLDATRDVHVATAALIGFIAVRDLYERRTALEAGRMWQRLHLWATARGIRAQPLNQLPEWVDREVQTGAQPATAAALADLLGTTEWKPTFAFRMGYADLAPRPSPRRDLATVVSL